MVSLRWTLDGPSGPRLRTGLLEARDGAAALRELMTSGASVLGELRPDGWYTLRCGDALAGFYGDELAQTGYASSADEVLDDGTTLGLEEASAALGLPTPGVAVPVPNPAQGFWCADCGGFVPVWSAHYCLVRAFTDKLTQGTVAAPAASGAIDPSRASSIDRARIVAALAVSAVERATGRDCEHTLTFDVHCLGWCLTFHLRSENLVCQYVLPPAGPADTCWDFLETSVPRKVVLYFTDKLAQGTVKP